MAATVVYLLEEWHLWSGDQRFYS